MCFKTALRRFSKPFQMKLLNIQTVYRQILVRFLPDTLQKPFQTFKSDAYDTLSYDLFNTHFNINILRDLSSVAI